MNIELRALDVQRGEAVVWHSGHWYRLRRERRWYPEDLGDRQPVRLSEPGLIQARKSYSSFAALVAEIEDVLQSGADSALVVKSRLRSSREPERHVREAWRNELPYLIHLYQGALDQLFARRGCTPEESRSLVLETFHRLFLLGPMGGREAEERLPLLAADVYREARANQPLPVVGERTGPVQRLPAGPNRRALEAMDDFDTLTLQCLMLWADDRSEADVALRLQLPEEEVRRRLDRAAAKLDRTRQEVRGRVWRRGFAVTLVRHSMT
jgi:hypothetical protein